MAIRVSLNHKTHYRYDRPVWLSPHIVRLRPAVHSRTPIKSYSLKVVPGNHFINWQQDPYGNFQARLVFPKKTKEFGFEVDLVAELNVVNPFDFFIDPHAMEFPFTYQESTRLELTPYLEKSPCTERFAKLVDEVRPAKPLKTVDFIVSANQKVHHLVQYLIRMEPGVQTPEETLKIGSGSCRDSAWLLVQIFRSLGLAARFVSGYLIQLKPDVKSLDGPSGTEFDFTDLHAWCEVYLPGAGWVGLDPTSGLLTAEGHIPLACTAEPLAAAPVTGFFSIDDEAVVEHEPEIEDLHYGDRDASDNFTFNMSVTRIREEPRVTKPFTDEQWQAIDDLGRKIDEDLVRNDVRLTMGGEPTFVSIDDMDGPEWNSDALGPNKRKLGDILIRRLRDQLAPYGLLHHGQGKWYPGESLPRWAFGLYWRKDGEALWSQPELIADPNSVYHFDAPDSQKFLSRVAERLGVNSSFVISGHEDVWYYLWKERRLPTNVDPYDSKLKNKEDRARLAKVFEQGLDKTVGYCLPIRKDYYTDGSSEWISGEWFLRSERMYLIPGDSPMGYRLPLDSIPWVAASEYPHIYERDPSETRANLPTRQRFLEGLQPPRNPADRMEQTLPPDGIGSKARPFKKLRQPDVNPSLQPAFGESAPWLVRTAICAETRNGVMHIFMPPVRYLEDYLEVVTAIEETANEFSIPVLMEGYTPPSDERLHVMKVTPDPGVIEVNTIPTSNWNDLVSLTKTVYQEARLSRLGTEKFMLDGRHTGTGGGNHIIIGGSRPSDSPLLRRPDLLKSLLGYWHNHPSLSYLFSNLFIGPTSQAPRIDEARNDQVYEIELAMKQIPSAGFSVAPWLVDRVFRDLLIDASGNTHRSEFCIDKLYSPDSSTGRLGLLEMRAFEMPPDYRMSLAQHLLLRCLVARFWKKPYDHQLVRWRTELHDRFMLPFFVWQDFKQVLHECRADGYDIKDSWFDAQLEFRFPRVGTIVQDAVEMEVRTAIEPWHVTGEDAGGGGTVRFVDSSLERVQILVNGMINPRHMILCNGHRVPLRPTGTNGQFVAGVRYRAWQPGRCLHPTIPVHSPLVFDLVDVWNNRAIGGCTYHVAHAGGLSYERFPVNSYEAESRRINRFFPFGHSPGPIAIPEVVTRPEFPYTLDLRWS